MIRYRDVQKRESGLDTTDIQSTLELGIRRLILLFTLGLIASGLTAFPLAWEIRIILDLLDKWEWSNSFYQWLNFISNGLKMIDDQYPFLSYGTDWLGFAHLVIAIVFIGPLKDPVRNKWVIKFGIIACISIFPFAFIAGELRGIPLYWRIIDCMFGIVGGLVLARCYQKIRKLESLVAS